MKQGPVSQGDAISASSDVVCGVVNVPEPNPAPAPDQNSGKHQFLLD